MKRFAAFALACTLMTAACEDETTIPSAPPAPSEAGAVNPPGLFTLTVLHNNDAESELIATDGIGGVAHFESVVERIRDQVAESAGSTPGNAPGGSGAILVSSGDNILAGPQLSASLENGVPFYDGLAMDAINYDAVAIGNHEFDFGPDVLADFIASFPTNPAPFLSANLDVAPEPALADLGGRIASSTVVELEGGHRVGIIGATTPLLPFISSPRNVVVLSDIAGAVNAEVSSLEGMGVQMIVLISHLQSVAEDLMLISMLRGVDVAVAGGGDELLANRDDMLIPGDEGNVFGPYPLIATDMEGNDVPVVTTRGGYRYVGQLTVRFNKHGKLVHVVDAKSGPVRVVGPAFPDGVAADVFIQSAVVAPVEAAVADLAANVIGSSEVPLNGIRPDIRVQETNEGNLIADALLWQATALAGGFGAPTPDVAIQNGGGIRNNSVIPAGTITELTTFDIVPFSNFVTIVPSISRSQFKEILENAVSRVEFVDGRWAHPAGFAYTYDPSGTPQELDADGNVVTPGTRIVDVTLGGGTPVVVGGVVQAGADLNIATIDFLARGGDAYPFRGASFTTLGATYQQALENYIVGPLGGVVTAAAYPVGGEGRISVTP